jgi:hypothetical protein
MLEKTAPEKTKVKKIDTGKNQCIIEQTHPDTRTRWTSYERQRKG